MQLTMILRASPDATTLKTAVSVLESWLAQGQSVALLFLQSDAVEICRTQQSPSAQRLQGLIADGHIPALACVGSAARRSLCDDRGQPVGTWSAGIQPGSLGELASALETADRLVSLG